jgi:GTP 3',8-cyclase
MPSDTLGRPLRDLRISVTDRCSFRCVYCMPREQYEGHVYLARSEILDYDEIARVARLSVELGVTKIRLTGGEPLLRRELHLLVGRLSTIDGVTDLAMTTNGQFLAAQAGALAAAGLSRVTVSLDGISDEVVGRMIDTDVTVETVIEGIDAAAAAGLGPIKVNAVIRRGWNEDQVLPLVERFRGTGHTVRFIEYMDVGTTNNWRRDEVVPTRDIVSIIRDRWPIEPVERTDRSEVAATYRFLDGAGTVGFISSVSQPFCADCTRLRLSAEGSLYTCLFASTGTDLKVPMRSGASDDDLRGIIERTWGDRADRYSEIRGGVAIADPKVEMSYIGG